MCWVSQVELLEPLEYVAQELGALEPDAPDSDAPKLDALRTPWTAEASTGILWLDQVEVLEQQLRLEHALPLASLSRQTGRS